MTAHSHDFPTELRLLEFGTLAVIAELHDPAGGILIGGEITRPLPNKLQARIKSARAGGSYRIGARRPDDGTLIVPISIKGSTWAQQQAREQALYAALDSVDVFYIEEILSGVTTRWYSDAPVDILPDPIDSAARINSELDYELRFLVQPNPTVSI